MEFSEFLAKYKYIWFTSYVKNPNKEFEPYCQPISLGDTDKILSNSALYATWWFIQNGFDGILTVNNTRKTEWFVARDRVSDTFTLTATNQNPKKCNISAYMEDFRKSFEMKCEIERLRSMKNK